MRFTSRAVSLFSFLAPALVASVAFAQGYPTKPVTVIVPWPPGGPSDIAARPLGKGLTDSLGKPFVIENRGGASGNIGTAVVAQSAPITNVLRVPLVLAVNPSVPAKNLKELLAHIKSQGGKFQYASSGSGTPQHLTAELFRTVAKLGHGSHSL